MRTREENCASALLVENCKSTNEKTVYAYRRLSTTAQLKNKADSIDLLLLAVVNAKAFSLTFSCGCDNETDDQAIKAKRFSEDKNKNHSHEQARLLRVRSDSSV